MNVWDEIRSLAEDQHGAFTTAQSVEAGGDRGWLARAERDRRIGRLFRGAYGVIGMLDDWTVAAAGQLVQPRAVLGYSAGAKLHGYDGVEAVRSELLVPPGARLRGLATRHVADLVVPEIVVVDGLRVTDEIRTLIDYAAIVDDDTLERAMESLFRRSPGARALLVDRARSLARSGKSGPQRVLRVEANMPLTPTESDLETVYWQVLRTYDIELPVRQFQVGRYRLDNAYPDDKVFVELDGYASHSSREAFVRDRHRQNELVTQGWVPLRFADSDVRHFGRRTAMQTDAMLRRRRRTRLDAVARV